MKRARWVFTCVSFGIVAAAGVACGAFSGSDAATSGTDAGLAGADGGTGEADAPGSSSDADSGEQLTKDGGADSAPKPDSGVLHVFASEEGFVTMDPKTVCQGLANASNLGGTWVAWLARPDGSPLTKMGAGPWHRFDGQDTLVATIADLEGGKGLQAPVGYTQHGEPILQADGGSSEMWTGLDATGTLTTNDCAQWTASSGPQSGQLGYADRMDTGWTTTGYVLCGSQARHIYCFQVN